MLLTSRPLWRSQQRSAYVIITNNKHHDILNSIGVVIHVIEFMSMRFYQFTALLIFWLIDYNFC